MLSHSQTRATHLAEEDEVQVQCVSCIMAVIRRKPSHPKPNLALALTLTLTLTQT